MKFLRFFAITVFFMILSLYARPQSLDSAGQKFIFRFLVREYTTKNHSVHAVYYKYGATRYQVCSSTRCTDLTVAGYKVRYRGVWQPIDYLEIDGKVFRGINPRKPLPYLYLVEVENLHETRLRVSHSFSSIPRKKKDRGIKVRWVVATGPVFTQNTSRAAILSIIRKSNIRPWDYTHRNAMFISKDGKSFMLVSWYGTVLDVLSIFHHHKEYFYLVMFDGGSSSYPDAVNPVWITIHSK